MRDDAMTPRILTTVAAAAIAFAPSGEGPTTVAPLSCRLTLPGSRIAMFVAVIPITKRSAAR